MIYAIVTTESDDGLYITAEHCGVRLRVPTDESMRSTTQYVQHWQLAWSLIRAISTDTTCPYGYEHVKPFDDVTQRHNRLHGGKTENGYTFMPLPRQ
jgi:hypothetical protein